jgi:hypothetical protein
MLTQDQQDQLDLLTQILQLKNPSLKLLEEAINSLSFINDLKPETFSQRSEKRLLSLKYTKLMKLYKRKLFSKRRRIQKEQESQTVKVLISTLTKSVIPKLNHRKKLLGSNLALEKEVLDVGQQGLSERESNLETKSSDSKIPIQISTHSNCRIDNGGNSVDIVDVDFLKELKDKI